MTYVAGFAFLLLAALMGGHNPLSFGCIMFAFFLFVVAAAED